jgi:hypothetical protein
MRLFIAAVGGSLILLGSQAVIAQPQSPAVIAKRQLSECMAKRMSASKNLSYNEAMRICKERLEPSKDTLAGISPVNTGAKSP